MTKYKVRKIIKKQGQYNQNSKLVEVYLLECGHLTDVIYRHQNQYIKARCYQCGNGEHIQENKA